ncbi:hypothetical protein Ddye_026085 [Dipteronia dyeriana]|uniref:CCHC-type domain-containing protein n=1 Tax=Dipteronia dyeriana TaxID=168575 RepID=A0AAD9TMK8_9ROSI|nr:hypothetical protein Ddye_026085 [Dipteronia dyeriana]
MLTIITAEDMEYELLGLDGSYAVKLRQYNYGCGSWQITGIPCCHAMAAISHSCGRDPVKDIVVAFVHQSLSKSTYIQTYRGMIHPIPNQKIWLEIEGSKLLPPHFETQHGRLKLQRKREPDEKSRGGRSGTVVCKNCGMAGHNKRTCKNEKQPIQNSSRTKNKKTNSTIGATTSQPPTRKSMKKTKELHRQQSRPNHNHN